MPPRELPDWLMARGRHWATTADVAALLDIPSNEVPPIAARWRASHRAFSPTPGTFVPIPSEFRSWAAVPASHFVDKLMRHFGHPYYVGYLSAAEVHGAAHQRPQVFHVVTDARLRARSFGRVRIAFVTSASTAARPTVTVNTPAGTMVVATPEVTVLDLVGRPEYGGGLSNVATVIAELLQDDKLDQVELARVATGYPTSVAQRTGWMVETAAAEIGADVNLDRLSELAQKRSEPTPLLASGARRGSVDERWHVVVNTDVEPDL